jgi:micrococcal nuclease
MIVGTSFETTVLKVVDGDTIDITVDGTKKRLRLASLDTEESNPGGDKPMTPWGQKAKEEAQRFFPLGSAVTIEFPGNDPLAECFERYLDNYERLLAFVHKDGTDYQEHMIRAGYSPYFVKYGNAAFAAHHDRYTQAESDAQGADAGLWNQGRVNGSERRNYAALGTWWELRARLIEDYRERKETNPALLLNSRLDYKRLVELAAQGATATVFTELRTTRPAGRHAIVEIGSQSQPFKLFVPDAADDAEQEILRLIASRYVPVGDDHTRRSYAYVTGPLKLYRGEPELKVTQASQIADAPPAGP